MGESAESKSFIKTHWEGWKEFWAERFSILDNYSRFLEPEKPLPHWDSTVVEEFIASDPVYGPTLKKARESTKFAVAGAAIGAVSSAGWAYKWSRSVHGSALSFAFGAAVGSAFGIEAANHWYQLYRLDTMAAQVKFFEWLQKRA